MLPPSRPVRSPAPRSTGSGTSPDRHGHTRCAAGVVSGGPSSVWACPQGASPRWAFLLLRLLPGSLLVAVRGGWVIGRRMARRGAWMPSWGCCRLCRGVRRSWWGWSPIRWSRCRWGSRWGCWRGSIRSPFPVLGGWIWWLLWSGAPRCWPGSSSGPCRRSWPAPRRWAGRGGRPGSRSPPVCGWPRRRRVSGSRSRPPWWGGCR